MEDIARFFLNPLGAILKEIKGHKVKDTEPYQHEQDRRKEIFIKELQE